MTSGQRVTKYVENAIKVFKNHVPSLQRLSEAVEVLDYRQPDSGIHALRVVFDRGYGQQRVYISGDIGYAVICPTCEASLAGIASCFTPRYDGGAISVEWGYFCEKIMATSDLYEWNCEDFVEDFKRCCEEKDIDLPEDWLVENMNRWGGDIEVDRVGVIIRGVARCDLKNKAPDYQEWFYDCGKRVAARIILWLVAMRLAYDALTDIVRKESEAAK